MAISMEEVNKKYGILGGTNAPSASPDLDPRYQTGGSGDGGVSDTAKRLVEKRRARDTVKVATPDQAQVTDDDVGVPGAGRYDAKEDPIAGLVKTQEDIRKEMADKAQEAIDAVNESYAGALRDEAVRGEDRMGQTRAAASRGGTLGSPMGRGRLAKTEQFNVDAEKRLDDARHQKVIDIRKGYDKLANERLEDERDFAFKTKEVQDAERDEFIIRGVQLMTDLAESGQNWDDVDKDIRDEILNNTGMSNLAARLRYNSLLPRENQVDFQYEKLSDDRYLFWGKDPVTGEVVQERFEYDVPDGSNLEILDGVPYFVTIDEDGNEILRKAEGFDSTSKELEQTGEALDLYQKEQEIAREKEEVALDLKKKQAEIDKIYSDINESDDPTEIAMKKEQLKKIQLENAKAVGEMPDSDVSVAEKATKAQSILDQITLLEGHDGISHAVGANILVGFGKEISGTESADFVAQYNKMKAILTIDNMSLMKGVLSDADIKILTDAGTALSLKQSEDKFKETMTELKRVSQIAVDKFNEQLASDFTELDDADADLFR